MEEEEEKEEQEKEVEEETKNEEGFKWRGRCTPVGNTTSELGWPH